LIPFYVNSSLQYQPKTHIFQSFFQGARLRARMESFFKMPYDKDPYILHALLILGSAILLNIIAWGSWALHTRRKKRRAHQDMKYWLGRQSQAERGLRALYREDSNAGR